MLLRMKEIMFRNCGRHYTSTKFVILLPILVAITRKEGGGGGGGGEFEDLGRGSLAFN